VVSAAVLLSLSAPQAMTAAGPVLLAAGVLIGLPHGAVDHLVPAWTGRASLARRGMAAVVAGYVLAALAAWAALTFAGPWALLGLMVLSVVHFGLGDVATGAERDGHRPPRGAPLACAVFARGAPVLVLPLVFWPEPLDAALDAFDPRVTELLSGPVRIGLLALLVCCGLVSVVLDRSAGRRLQVAELLALWLLFTVTPPLAAFGIYFGCWHSLRHVARLLVADPRNAADLAGDRLLGPLRRFARSAAIPTLGSLAGLAALVAVASSTPLLVPMLSVLMALTVPHAVFVAMLDATVGDRASAQRSLSAGRR
jgi:Brp/Blh family beta-carotene 15,15'-monooxygenase